MEDLIVRIVELSGSPFVYGLEQSKEIKSTKLIEQLKLLEHLSLHSKAKIAKELLNRISPSLLEELRGIAEGMNVELDTIIKLYSGYDVTFPSMGCSTLMNNDFYVRNYDFSPKLYDARLVFSKPSNGYASVGFSQQVIGRLDGMNEKGLVVGLHFVNNEHRGEGFLATTIVRMLLELCASIEEAINLITTIPHGFCYNYSITDQSGRGVVVEATPQKQIVSSSSPHTCTNHFETKSLQSQNRIEIEESLKRKKYLRHLLAEELSSMTAYRYFNDGHSPLFYKHYKEYFGTLHTVVYSPKDLSLIVGVGENSEPAIFSLKKYLDGSIILPKVLKGRINQASLSGG